MSIFFSKSISARNIIEINIIRNGRDKYAPANRLWPINILPTIILKDIPSDDTSAPRAYVIYVREEQKDAAFSLLGEIRAAGLSADMNYAGKSIKAQMRAAEKAGASFAAILGPDEVEKGVVNLKNMETGEEREVPLSDIPSAIK